MAHSKGVVFIHYWRLDSCDFCSVFFEEAARLLKAVQDPVQLCASHNLASSTQHNTAQHNRAHHRTTQHSTTQHNTTQHNTPQHNTTSCTHNTPAITQHHVHTTQ